MKKLILILSTIIMFFFKSSATANYDKIFYDLNIESISGEIIHFSEYKNKVIVVLQINMKIYRNYGICIKLKD